MGRLLRIGAVPLGFLGVFWIAQQVLLWAGLDAPDARIAGAIVALAGGVALAHWLLPTNSSDDKPKSG